VDAPDNCRKTSVPSSSMNANSWSRADKGCTSDQSVSRPEIGQPIAADIHVVGLERGQLATLEALVKHDPSFVVNLGTRQGYSVSTWCAHSKRCQAGRCRMRSWRGGRGMWLRAMPIRRRQRSCSSGRHNSASSGCVWTTGGGRRRIRRGFRGRTQEAARWSPVARLDRAVA
jgi:hypothetical protein